MTRICRIVVEKSARRLRAFDESGEIFLEARVQLGFGAGDGPKCREGDGRTPEGKYRVCSKNPASKFFRALGVSYPNAADARAALERGDIDAETCAALCRAEEERVRPDWNTPLGGWIMLHGQHPDGPQVGDWTAGCIAVENDVMETLFECADYETAVEIYP